MNPPAARENSLALTVLALNSGSSSLKFGLYRVDAARADCVLEGNSACTSIEGQTDAMREIAARVAASGVPEPQVIGHRIVHGGPSVSRHALIDAPLLQHLEDASAFAPLHAGAGLAIIRRAQHLFPGRPQVACLDTVFHAELPAVARTLPIASDVCAESVHRYGFHGLSCESIVEQLGTALPERLVIAHLGQGASVTAVRAGRSVDTSMGLTPTGGLMMGTRSGDLDPGLLIYLMREKGMDAEQLEALVNRRSGLIGVSGLSGDMRELHAAAASNSNAALAIEMFCMGVRKQVALMAAVLGGIDRLVFTGGIGENDAAVRRSVCAGLAWVDGLQTQVLPSNEGARVARHAWTIVGNHRA